MNATPAAHKAPPITAGTAALLASDLLINIVPRAYASYQGTAAQLIAEGLIPGDFKWPSGAGHATVKADSFCLCVFRTRPEGHNGPKSSWISGDYWHLRRELTHQPINGRIEAAIYAKQMELAEIIYLGTTEWRDTFHRACRARMDDKYMAFRTHLLGDLAPRKRGRPARSSPTGQSQGASA